MDNQHRQIKGYRELSQEEIDLMNAIKTKGVELGELVAKLRATEGLDQRWISIGATDFRCTSQLSGAVMAKKQKAEPAQNVDNSTTITNSAFYGVKWDEAAVGAVQTIADGLVENAKALGALAQVLKASNVQIEAMIKVTGA